MTTPLQVEYQWQDSDGDAIMSILDLPEASPGVPSVPIELKLFRSQVFNLGPYAPSIPAGEYVYYYFPYIVPFVNTPIAVESELKLGVTLWTRGVSGGTSEYGSEMIAESWLEYSTDGATWHAIGAGPDVDIAGLFEITSEPEELFAGFDEFDEPIYLEMHPAIADGEQTATIYFRLNIPADAVTTGDFRAHLEVFVR